MTLGFVEGARMGFLEAPLHPLSYVGMGFWIVFALGVVIHLVLECKCKQKSTKRIFIVVNVLGMVISESIFQIADHNLIPGFLTGFLDTILPMLTFYLFLTLLIGAVISKCGYALAKGK